jgi:hypothetical protein
MSNEIQAHQPPAIVPERTATRRRIKKKEGVPYEGATSGENAKLKPRKS